MPLNVEEALKQMEDQAAMVRALADLASRNGDPLSSAALSGMADACGQVEGLARDTRTSLSPDALCQLISTWVDADDAPEMHDESFKNATLAKDIKGIRRGPRAIPDPGPPPDAPSEG